MAAPVVSAEVAPARTNAWLCGLIYVALFAVQASVLGRMRGFALDDSWIHLVIARNLAHFHVFGFLPGTVTTGSTSLLWTVILTIETVLLPGSDPVVVSALVSAVILGAIGYNLYRLAQEDRLARGWSWCLALAPAISGNFLWLGLIGMEHLLFLLLSVLWVRWWYRPVKGAGYLATLALICCLFGLARPEAFFFVGLLLIWRGSFLRRPVDALAAAAGSAGALLITMLMNLKTAGHLLPQTLEGRRLLISPHIGLRHRMQFLALVVGRMFKVWTFIAPKSLSMVGRVVALVLVLALFGLLAAGVRELMELRSRRFLALAAWGLLIVALYFFLLPAAIHGGRYISPLLLMFPGLVLAGLAWTLSRVGLSRTVVAALVAVFAVGTAVRSITIWREATAADIRQIGTEHAVIAGWVRDHVPPEAIAHRELGVFDIGRIGYEFQGNVVDLGGLVDGAYLPYMRAGRVGPYLRSRGIHYLILPAMEDEKDPWFMHTLGLDEAHGVRLEPVHEVCADKKTADLAARSSWIAAQCQELLAVHYLD